MIKVLQLSPPSTRMVTWARLPRRTILGECSECHAAVPQGRYQEHVRWHSGLLLAPDETPAATMQASAPLKGRTR